MSGDGKYEINLGKEIRRYLIRRPHLECWPPCTGVACQCDLHTSTMTRNPITKFILLRDYQRYRTECVIVLRPSWHGNAQISFQLCIYCMYLPVSIGASLECYLVCPKCIHRFPQRIRAQVIDSWTARCEV